MSDWKSSKARKVLKALENIGWEVIRQKGSHKVLAREGWENYVFAFHDGEETEAKMMARIVKKRGLKPKDF